MQRLARARIYLQFEWLIVAFQHPSVMRIPERNARKHLEAQVPDRELREKLTPDYSLGCKRILLSDDYLPALTQPNVAVNTDGIRGSANTASLTTRASSMRSTRSFSGPVSTRSACR